MLYCVECDVMMDFDVRRFVVLLCCCFVFDVAVVLRCDVFGADMLLNIYVLITGCIDCLC